MYQSTNFNGKLNVSSKKIKELRMKKNLSLSRLSTKLALMGVDITKPSLHKLETGKRVLKDYELFALCHIFEVPVEELLDEFIKELKIEDVV